MGKAVSQMKPSVCLECIAGQTTGEMLDYLGFGSTLILYGLLSDQPAGGIKTINFIGKNQTLEGFLLFVYLNKLTNEGFADVINRAKSMYKNELRTSI